MQFSFKRPQTSKSVSAFYRDKQKTNSLPKGPQPTYSSPLDDPLEQNKKWKQAAEKINREMVIHRALHVNSEPFRLLSKMGGQVFNSQPKLTQPEAPSKARIRISSKQKRGRDNSKESIPLREMREESIKLLQPPITESKLKRKRRNQNFRGLQQQLKTTNIFYESPVVKIGYNMQYEAYLRFQHISQIRPDHGGSICRNSMIFFLKDAPFSPNIISQKNTEVPITLSLFPEFFDSKLSISNQKRQRYFERMLAWMNSTYDPERMAALPHFSNYPPFDEDRYNEIAQSLVVSNEQNYKAEWAENIVKKLRIKLSDHQLREALSEQWQFFNRANSIITLDYVLKNSAMASKLNIAPFLPTRVITARRILYHGGYCKSLYSSWSTYVDNSRKRLVGRLRSYNNTTQSIFGWYCNFEKLHLYQADFSIQLGESLSVELFHKIQLAKIQFSTDVLQQIWFRGILCLLHYNRFLATRQNQYEQLGDYRHLLSRYIQQARNRSHEMKSGEEIETFYLNFYENFLNSLRKDCRINSLQDLMPAQKGETPQLSNLKVLLHIQFSRTIERSLISLRQQIVNYQKPLLRLHLVIDRQSFKFLEQEDDIVNAFASMIKKILGARVDGYALACKFQSDNEEQNIMGKTYGSNNFSHELRPKSSNVREYPQIYETGERNSLQQEKDLNISYKTEFIFDEQIREVISCMRIYYKQCFSVLGEYEMYLPFIKLTTTQKIFSEQEGSVEQSFLKNLRVVSRYKESINHLHKLVRINIFQVDCSAPIRALEQRVREIQYIIEQNYINIIHEKIESVDSELNSLKISAHNVGLTAVDIEETEQKLISIQHNLKQLQVKTKKIAEMVLFCLDNRRKVETVVTCFCQLVSKKQELHRDIDNLFTTLESKRPEVQAESEQQVEQLLKSIAQCLQKGSEVETTCFEFVNMPEYIISIQALVQSFNELNSEISKHFQHSKIKSKLPVEERINLFRRESERFELMIEYWKQFYTFETYFKEIAKSEARSLDFTEFSGQTKSSEEVIQRMQKTEQEWWHKDKIRWKPIIHRMHEYYSKKFKADVETCSQLKSLLQILTNRKVRDRHWQLYGLENYRNIIFRQLIRLDTGQQQSKLQKMDEDVNFEYEIYLAYQEIQKQIKGHRLLIVDLNDSDVLDLQNLNKCVEFLRNVEIDIKYLMQKDVGDYYDGELHELLILAQTTVIKIEEWRNVEERYIRFIKFHMINDQYEHSLFSALIELHRKLIKSYDIDNSVAFISKNIVMDSYLSQISEELKELQTRVTRYLASMRSDYPRLFLLTDEQLFDFMSCGANIQKYLRKCFPQIFNFGIREGSIERIGERRELIFAEPFYIQEMIGRVNNWVSSLEDLIKCRLKEFFKTNQIITEGKSTIELQINFYEKYPTQLAILDEQIMFTEQISDAVVTATLRTLLQQIQSKIEYLIKEKKETFKLLLYLIFREQINALMREEDLHSQSFQWLKYPRFVRKSQLDIRVAFINQENTYGFNYLEKSQVIHTDNVFMGNCLIGPSGSGKTAFARYLAYLCGQQLLIFDPRSINHFQQSISSLVNYFRVNAFVGNWLLLQRIDLLGQSQLKLIAECLSSVQESLRQQSNKLTLSGQTTPMNKNSRVLLTICSLTNKELPGRLCVIIRPVWVVAPNQRFLLELYLQSKRVNNIEVGKILKFCSWLQNHRQISLEILNWIRDQEDPEIFSSAIFFQKACCYGLFQGEGQSLLQALKSEDLTLNGLSEQSTFIHLQDEILSNHHMVIFGERSSGKTWDVIHNLTKGKYLIINAYNYQRNEELFDIVRSIRNLQGFSHVVFKHGLQFYPLMRQNLTNFKVIFVESNLAQLQLGVVFDLKMINYQHLAQNGINNDNPIQQIVSKMFKGELLQSQKAFERGSIFLKCIEKLVEALNQRANVNQLFISFSQILKIMLDEGYEFNTAYLFSIIWTFGFELEEKKIEEILRQVLTAEQQIQKTKFQKINQMGNSALIKSSGNLRRLEENFGLLFRETFTNRLISLTELVPLKKGKFIGSLQSVGFLGSYQDIQLIGDITVNLKSNFIYNLNQIRRSFPSTIAIEGRDWLTTVLNASNPTQSDCKTYNFGNRASGEVFLEIFKGSKRNGIFYHFPTALHITIDDVHLCKSSTLNSLRDLSEYSFALFLQSGMIRIFQTSNCQFTFGGKFPHKIFEKAMRVVIEQNTISTIFNEYVQSYCEKQLQIDRSIFSLLNLASNISRTYKDQDNRYFWFKNPLLLLQSTKTSNLTELIEQYLDYLKEILPQEKANLNSQRTILQISRDSTDSQDGPEVINTTRKFIKYYNQSQLIEELVADNEILEEIQASQVESIFFQRFIKYYFTKDILNYVLKIDKFLKSHHLILLGDNYGHADKILRYACKISARMLTSFRSKAKPIPNEVFTLDLEHCKEKDMELLLNVIKLKYASQYDGLDVRFVLTGNLSSPKLKVLYSKYPFLRSHFLNIVLQEKIEEVSVSNKEIKSNKFVGETASNDYLQRLQTMARLHHFDDELKQEFVRILEKYRKEEYTNLQFYRKVSSEMMINIDRIHTMLANIPKAITNLSGRDTELFTNKNRNLILCQELNQKHQKWEDKRVTFTQLFNFKNQKQIENLNRLNQNCNPLFAKMDKIEKKLDTFEVMQFSRLKNNLKNNENSALVQPLHGILAFLNEKGDTAKEKIHQFVATIFANPASLASLLRNIHHRQVYDKQVIEEESHISRLISTGMNSVRLKYFLSRADEVNDNAKKFEKVSPIYKPISSWLVHFHNVCQHLKDYLDQQEEVDTHLTEQLLKFNQKYSENPDITYQKQNLHVSITESQNKIQEIQEAIEDLSQYNKSSQIQQKKIVRLKRFFNEREERLERISKLLIQSEYMKKVSAGVSLYFKNIDHLSFHRALLKTTRNQYLEERMLDPDLLLGVFTSKSELFKFREKLQAQNISFQELEIIYNLVEKKDKCFKLVQDRNSIIKNKLIDASEARGYFVQVFQHANFNIILKFMQTKLTENFRLLILHENIHYLEVGNKDDYLFDQFIEEGLNLIKERNAEVIYVTNCLHKVNPQLVLHIESGRVVITKERFMSDLSDIFNVAMQKETMKPAEPKKRRGDFETVVKQKNTMTKELMSSIENLSHTLSASESIFTEHSLQEIEGEQIYSQNLQNHLINLIALEQEQQNLQRETTNYTYLPETIRDLIQKELQRYLVLYQFTDSFNNTTNNQFFSGKEFYREWINLLKNLREERITWFNRQEYRSVISEIVVKNEVDEKQREEVRPKGEEGETIQINQAINPIFHKNNQDIYIYLVEKILKGTTWLEKSFLFQYTLGACIIQAFQCYSHSEFIMSILDLKIGGKQQINEECLRVLKIFDEDEFYRGYQIRFDKLTNEFFEALEGNIQPFSPGYEVSVFAYYYLMSKFNQYDPKIEQFLTKFYEISQKSKSPLVHRYQFIKSLKTLRLMSEYMLKLTPPLNLSINLDSRGDKEKLITIIEEEKYLLNDLVELLKVKSLSKKRELESILINMQKKEELIETLKHHYRSSKQWVLLANFSIKNRSEVRQLLEEILCELGRLQPNPFFRIFIVLIKEEEGEDSLYYNKYQINRVKGCHNLSDTEYYESVNQIALQELFDGRGRELIEQLIHTTIKDQDEISIAETRLEDLKSIFSKLTRKHRFLRQEDFKLYYKNLVWELLKLGYLKKDHNELNFYKYIANYFVWVPRMSSDYICKQIEDDRELNKQGISDALIIQNARGDDNSEQIPIAIERINMQKIEEYFKNINSEFAEILRKEIVINNHIQADQQFLSALQDAKGITKSALKQANRICHIKYGLTNTNEKISWTTVAALKRLPLLRLLNNLKLREICNNKKVDIQTSAEFWIFLTAFQHKEIKEFTKQLALDRSELDSRYSNGIGLFGNFMNTRDYATRMKMVLIDVECYNELAISEEELTKILTSNEKVEGRFLLAIRKANPQKIVELNMEHYEVEKILQKFNIVLQIGGELTLEVTFK